MRASRRSLAQAAAKAAAQPKAESTKPGVRKFDKILIANRGEISVRVSKTAHKLGIKTVAIYSDPDANAVHVRAADEAVCVGPAPSSASYLNVPRILHAIQSTGAQGVHPGYGFLSENGAFAKVLEDNGVKFIGPRSHSIEAMGDKIESKALAIKAGVNTIPGFMGTVGGPEEAIRIARDIGYPVMIKASAGGGGKGMRVAYNDAEVVEGYRLSKEEAKSSFGDDRLFVEKFIEDPRHIEIQLIADAHGNVAALPERECSIQRRNQKVIEESPSVLLDEKTRRAMQEQAAALARAVGYESAGTVEFLADKNKNFYFLEMNTRLQVEHPVTEMVTGLDLVELMIRVAEGHELPAKLREPVPIIGHAFESRVYAEDPFRGFLPSTGRLSRYQEPAEYAAVDPFLGSNIRADAGVSEGSEISMFYDPMICKLVTHGKDRADALDRMRGALDAYVVRGVGHNISFLRDLADHPRFVEGRLTTGFIKEEYPNGFKGVQLGPGATLEMVAGAAVMNVLRQAHAGQISGQLERTAAPSGEAVVVQIGQRKAGSTTQPPTFHCTVAEEFGEDGETHWAVTIAEGGAKGGGVAAAKTVRLSGLAWSVDAPLMLANIEGAGHLSTEAAGGKGKHASKAAAHEVRPSESVLRLQHLAALPDGFRLQYRGAVHDVYVRTPLQHVLNAHMLPKPERDTSRLLSSPMPGKLVSVAVVPGQEVELGQECCVMEAMKMQNVLRSPRKGKVKAVKAKAGDTLAVDQIILEFE